MSMQIPLQVTFRHVDPSEAVDAYVRERASKLETFYDRIVGCRVAIEAPHRHKEHGRVYRVRIDVTVPGGEIVVGHEKADRLDFQDVYAAVDAAFAEAHRQVHEHAARLRERRRSA